jgi:hypothetical protein
LRPWQLPLESGKLEARRSKFRVDGELSKNREMKEGPTILLITKDRFSEPTMFMKTNKLAKIGHDVVDSKRVG